MRHYCEILYVLIRRLEPIQAANLTRSAGGFSLSLLYDPANETERNRRNDVYIRLSETKRKRERRKTENEKKEEEEATFCCVVLLRARAGAHGHLDWHIAGEELNGRGWREGAQVIRGTKPRYRAGS